jgi:hypothetical protein
MNRYRIEVEGVDLYVLFIAIFFLIKFVDSKRMPIFVGSFIC